MHVPQYLLPYLFLRACQLIGERPDERVDSGRRPDPEMVAGPVLLLPERPKGADELGELLKDKPVPRLEIHFFIFRKMDAADRIIVLRQVAAQAQALRQQLPFQGHLIQRLAHRLHDCIVGEPACQRVHGLHGVQFFLISGRGIEHLRMLHDKSALFPGHKAPQRDHAALCKGGAQKRHAEPDDLQRAGYILYMDGRHLHGAVPGHLHAAENGARDRLHFPLFQLADRHSLLIDVISARVVAEQIPHRTDAKLQKQFFRLLPDPFELMDRRQFVHTVLLLLNKEVTGKSRACYFFVFCLFRSIRQPVHNSRSAVLRNGRPHPHPDISPRSLPRTSGRPPPSLPHRSRG